jgi:hypothetical protein
MPVDPAIDMPGFVINSIQVKLFYANLNTCMHKEWQFFYKQREFFDTLPAYAYKESGSVH